ncbi:ATPase [Synergistales bacterium]|nr:ATPase [Synergistales bacterium]
MARADLLCDVIKYGLNSDSVNLRKVVEAICAEERTKQHGVLANRIEEMLRVSNRIPFKELPTALAKNSNGNANVVIEKIPERNLDSLLLPKSVLDSCHELVAEHMRADILRSHGLEPRNKVLLIGPPGNGKTSLAEALAEALMLPFLTVRYESLVGAYLGETASRLNKLFEYTKTRQCVLFFDEFETLGKERGDTHETGEIKRVVSSLLLQIDALPSYVIVVAATNHEALLDRAAWRRFQLRLLLPRPSRDDLQRWFNLFEERNHFDLGLEPLTLAKKLYGKSFAEAEEFALSVYRQYVLQLPDTNAKAITQNQLALYAAQANVNRNEEGVE